MNFEELILLTRNKNLLIDFLTTTKLIPSSRRCPKCTKKMTITFKQSFKLGKAFTCKRCNKRICLLAKTVFANKKISVKNLLKFIYLYFENMDSYKNINKECKFSSRRTINKYKKIFRKIMVEIRLNLRKNKKIGVFNKEVQVDESLVFKRKFNKGRLVKEVWIIGGICSLTNEVFIEEIKDRTRQTIEEVLARNVLPGTEITTDKWKSYYKAVKIIKNSTHYIVNHSTNFVDPVTMRHTNRIEGFWSVFKQWMRRRGYNKGSKKYFVEYVNEYLIKEKEKYTFELFCSDFWVYLNNYFYFFFKLKRHGVQDLFSKKILQ